MKQNEILMIGGVAVLGIAVFTMMNKGNSNQSQQMQQQMMLQQMQMMQQQQRQPVQQVNTNTGGGSSAPKPSTVDKAQGWVNVGKGILDVVSSFRGVPQARPLI